MFVFNPGLNLNSAAKGLNWLESWRLNGMNVEACLKGLLGYFTAIKIDLMEFKDPAHKNIPKQT